MFATISLVKETLSKFEEAQHSITKSNVDVTKERMFTFSHQLRFVISPPMLDQPQNGSISNLQQNVKENPSGNSVPIVSFVVPFEDIEVAPIKKDKGTRRNGCGIQGCQKQFRLPRRTKIQLYAS